MNPSPKRKRTVFAQFFICFIFVSHFATKHYSRNMPLLYKHPCERNSEIQQFWHNFKSNKKVARSMCCFQHFQVNLRPFQRFVSMPVNRCVRQVNAALQWRGMGYGDCLSRITGAHANPSSDTAQIWSHEYNRIKPQLIPRNRIFEFMCKLICVLKTCFEKYKLLFWKIMEICWGIQSRTSKTDFLRKKYYSFNKIFNYQNIILMSH